MDGGEEVPYLEFCGRFSTPNDAMMGSYVALEGFVNQTFNLIPELGRSGEGW